MKRTVISSLIAFAALFIMVSGAQAYKFYSVGVSESGMCADCHQGYRDTGDYFSNKDGAFWGTSLHNGHLNNTTIGSSCDNCHGGAETTQRQVNLSSSGNAADGVNAISCSGCHEPTGLRAHHAANGVTSCAGCHSGDPTPPAENIAPPWYGSVTNNITGTNLEPCNANGEEDFAGSPLGLDNDGDNAYDTDDTDCAAGCTVDADCDNGLFCDGAETCDTATGECLTGTSPVIDDGVGCTDDSCDEANDVVVNAPNDSLCDNGLFCDGSETCDAVNDCQAGTSPVIDDGVGCTDDSCDEANDVVVNAPNDSLCDNGQFCDGSETCDAVNDCQAGTPLATDDGVGCTDDSCDEANDVVVNAANDANCDNGQFCDGSETCDAVNDCQAGTPVDCTDPVGCTEDFCDEVADACVNIADDTSCDDGLFCNGTESCDEATDCAPSTGNPCAEGEACNEGTDTCEPTGCLVDADCDNGLFCDGSETCDTATGTCLSGTPVVCDDGVGCTDDVCDEANDTCASAANDANCDNGLFCDGSETCDAVNDCQAGTSPVTDDGVGCTDDSCDEANDVVVNAPNDSLCDNGQFCDGSETCDAVNDCQAGSDPCAAGETCNETNDTCDTAPECTVDADCDNGLFCDGAETCISGTCQSGSVPCGAGETCNDVTDTCDVATCTDYPDKGTCQMDPACAWVGKGKNGSCQDAPIPGDCAAYADRNSCNADMACSWNKKAGICEDAGSSVTCSDYSGPGNEALCLANDCNWNSKKQTCR